MTDTPVEPEETSEAEDQDVDPEWADAVGAERAVVGALLLAGGTLQREILRIVADDDFADATAGWLVRQLRAMVDTGHPVSAVTFPGWLHRTGRTPLESTRRQLRVLLADMMREAEVPSLGPWYAAQVVELAARRAVRPPRRRC